MTVQDTQAEEAAALDLHEPSRFAGFFKSEWSRLRSYLSRFVARADAEEIAQEAFIRVYATEGEVRSPTGLLYHTARNLLSNSRRDHATAARVVVESADAEFVADRSASPEEQIDQRDRLERAAVMLGHMPDKMREIFLLQVIDGYTYAEIAGQLGVSVVSVKKRLLRAFEICASHAETDERRSGRRNERARRKRVKGK